MVCIVEGNRGSEVKERSRDLVQATCAFRLLSQEVELSLSTRESAVFRNHAFRLGFTSMSAGSKTNPGGYTSAPESLEQFSIDDEINSIEASEEWQAAMESETMKRLDH